MGALQCCEKSGLPVVAMVTMMLTVMMVMMRTVGGASIGHGGHGTLKRLHSNDLDSAEMKCYVSIFTNLKLNFSCG